MNTYTSESAAIAARVLGEQTVKVPSGHFDFPGKARLAEDAAAGKPLALRFVALVGMYRTRDDDGFAGALQHAAGMTSLREYAASLEAGRVWVDTSVWVNSTPVGGGDGSEFSDHEAGDTQAHNPWQKH